MFGINQNIYKFQELLKEWTIRMVQKTYSKLQQEISQFGGRYGNATTGNIQKHKKAYEKRPSPQQTIVKLSKVEYKGYPKICKREIPGYT